MRELLSLDETRRSPLLKGPYVSLSCPFKQGAPVEDLVAEGLLHPLLRKRIPEAITHLCSHHEKAVRAVAEGRTTLVSTGTGSGKTECFLYPIVSKCLELRDEGVPPTGYRFTVKRYRSEKHQDEGGWRHVRVLLEPDNPDFEPIEITTDDEETVNVVAKLVEVLGYL